MYQPKVEILTNTKNHQTKVERKREREHNGLNGPKWTKWTKVN